MAEIINGTSEVATAHARFDDRPIRDFVPIFVERIVRARLET